MRLKGAEAIQYLQSNPKAGYKVISGGGGLQSQQQAPQRDFLSNLIHGIGSPITRTADLAKGAAYGDEFKPQYFYSQPEWEAAKERGLGQEWIKSGVGLASWMVPGAGVGGGILKSMPGLLAGGALGGLSMTEGDILSEQALKDTLMGAGTSAVVGGGLGLLGKLGKGAGKGVGAVDEAVVGATGQADEAVSQGLKGKVIGGARQYAQGREMNALKRIVGGGKVPDKLGGVQLLKDTVDEATSRGMVINSADDALKLSAQIFDEHGNTVKDAVTQLSTEGKKFDVGQVRKTLKNLYDEALPSERSMIQKVINDVDGHVAQWGDDVASGYSLKQKLGPKGKWSPVYDLNLKPGIEAYEKAYIAINDDLSSKVGKDAFRKANQKVEYALRLKQYAEKGNLRIMGGATFNDPMQDVALAGGLLAGGPGAAGGALIGKALQAPQFERALGKGVGKVADIAEKGLPSINLPNINMSGLQGATQGIGGAIGKVAPYMPNMAVMGGAGLMGNMPQGQQDQQMPQAPQGQSLLGGQQGAQQAGGLGGLTQEKLAMGVMTGLIPLDQAKFLMDMIGGGEAQKLTQKQGDYRSAGIQAGKALQMLESGNVQTGPVTRMAEKFKAGLDVQSPEQTQYYALLDSARSVAISALSGANVPPSEYERLQAMIPDPKDQEGVAKQKLKAFMEAMDVYASGSIVEPTGMGLQSI